MIALVRADHLDSLWERFRHDPRSLSAEEYRELLNWVGSSEEPCDCHLCREA